MGSVCYGNILCEISHKVWFQSRYISLFCKQQANKNSLSKQGKVFNKLIAGPSKKKRKFIFDDCQAPPSASKLSLGQHIKHNKENSRRIAVLNSVFMKHISDLLVTGNIGVDVVGKGLEISRVSMNPNFDQLNVFWGTSREENITELENVLPNIGYTLRHELSQLRVVGIVPRIIFIKDKNFNNGAMVDYLLRRADFGEDHVPTELGSDFKDSSLPTPDERKLLKDEETSSETPLEEKEIMPDMRHDVFNLDHQHIMNKILKRMHKSRAIHRFEHNLAIKSDGNSTTSIDVPQLEMMTKEERKEALAKFILSRKILQEKKRQNKHKSEREIYVLQESVGEDEEEDFPVEDYIEEDFEENKFQN